MFWTLFMTIFCNSCLSSLNAQRRITNGHTVAGEKRYMVYLLQAPPQNFSAWTCGGVIISKNYLLTSASCVRTVPYSYVISGYRKYVNARNMQTDDCIMRMRRKIVSYCHPKHFEPQNTYNTNPNGWSYGDICIARVDTPFDIGNKSYYYFCSYPPGTIGVNYHKEFHRNFTDVITLGWGHTKYYKPIGETMDLNSEYLQYSSGTITSNHVCKEAHKPAFQDLSQEDHMEHFLICVSDSGNLDENGHIINENTDYHNTCNITYNPAYGRQNTDNSSAMDCYADSSLRTEYKYNASSDRVGGFCQNDHGGPLVAWIGGRETVIGVATIFAVASDMQCRTPYLYTTTVSINKLLACFLWTNFTSSRRRSLYCDSIMAEMDYTQKDVTWTDDVW